MNSHAKWMESTHYRDGDKALLIYNITRSPEMTNPMDPSAGHTGRTQFMISEVYESPAGLQDHWQQAQSSWKDFGALNEWLGKVDMVMVNGGEIFRSLW